MQYRFRINDIRNAAMKKRISILGCGWLGLPLGEVLSNHNYAVKGSTRSEEKLKLIENNGMEPYQADMCNLHGVDTAFWEADVLLVTLPPDRKNPEQFLEQLNMLKGIIEQQKIPHVLLTSSIGIYPDLEETMQEEHALSNHFLANIENLFLNGANFQTTVLRLAGLMGGDRHPGRFFAGKKGVKGPIKAINFVHLDDVIQVIVQLIEKDVWGEVFNVCADEHPTRETFYTVAAMALEQEAPEFDQNDDEMGKLISSEKLKQTINYTFIHSNPLLAL